MRARATTRYRLSRELPLAVERRGPCQRRVGHSQQILQQGDGYPKVIVGLRHPIGPQSQELLEKPIIE
jgi:hypothetical protein